MTSDTIHPERLEAELQDSDRAYFAAGAAHRASTGAAIRWMSGLQHLAAGCIVEPTGGDVLPQILVRDACRALTSIGAPLFRLYASQADRRLERWLGEAGFEPSAELAVVRRVREPSSWPESRPGLSVRPVQCPADWRAKTRLAAALAERPDGKAASPLEWTDLERRKAEAGFARFWIVEDDGEPCGTFGLSAMPRMLRLKNLAVHPKFRRRGVATAAIHFALRQAAEHRLGWLGAFAIPGGGGDRLYRACGFERVGVQTEWTRTLVLARGRSGRALAAAPC